MTKVWSSVARNTRKHHSDPTRPELLYLIMSVLDLGSNTQTPLHYGTVTYQMCIIDLNYFQTNLQRFSFLPFLSVFLFVPASTFLFPPHLHYNSSETCWRGVLLRFEHHLIHRPLSEFTFRLKTNSY